MIFVLFWALCSVAGVLLVVWATTRSHERSYWSEDDDEETPCPRK